MHPGSSSYTVSHYYSSADLSCRVPAIRVVASPVSPSIAALVATSMPATTRLTSIKDIWVVDVLQIKAEKQKTCRSSTTARVSIG